MASKKIEEAAQEYVELRAKKDQIEERAKQLKSVLEPFLRKQPEMTCELVNWKFTLLDSERETFKLSEAKEKLPAKVLSPFLSVSKFSQIRTVYKGPK